LSASVNDPVTALLRALDSLELDGRFAFGEVARMKLATAVGDAHEHSIAQERRNALEIATRACGKVADAFARNGRGWDRLSCLAAAEECTDAVRSLTRQASAPGTGTHVAASRMHPKTPENKGVHAGDGSAPRRHTRGRA
jgi:hypothetical protein